MMHLPALAAQERACLQDPRPHGAAQSFAFRLRQRLIAGLGAAVEVSEAPVAGAPDLPADDEPAIAIQPELAAAWLSLRLGGRPGAAEPALKDARLAEAFRTLIRRTLAESVFNGGEAAWPARLRLRLVLDGRQGDVDIVWNSAHARAWARRAIKEKA